MKNKILILVLIILFLTPNILYADYVIDTSNSIIQDGWIVGTNITAHYSLVNCIDEQGIKQALDEVDFNFNGTFTVNIVDYSTYLQDILGLALPDNQIILFDFIPLPLDMTFQNTVVHELGHLVYMQMSEEEQEEYRRLRCIPIDWDNYPRTPYTNRPQEVFAEDFRLMFGGKSSTIYLHHNQELDNPNDVEGLKNFIKQFEYQR